MSYLKDILVFSPDDSLISCSSYFLLFLGEIKGCLHSLASPDCHQFSVYLVLCVSAFELILDWTVLGCSSCLFVFYQSHFCAISPSKRLQHIILQSSAKGKTKRRENGEGRREREGKGAPALKTLAVRCPDWLIQSHFKYSAHVYAVIQKSTRFFANLWLVVCWRRKSNNVDLCCRRALPFLTLSPSPCVALLASNTSSHFWQYDTELQLFWTHSYISLLLLCFSCSFACSLKLSSRCCDLWVWLVSLRQWRSS